MNRIINSILFLLIVGIPKLPLCQGIMPQWAVQIGGKGDDRCIKVCNDNSGNLYFTSAFEDNALLTTSSGTIDSLFSFGKEDILFGKVDGTGNLLWTKHYGGKGIDLPTELKIAPDGSLFFAGIFQDSLYFDSDTLISGGYIDSFIAKFDSIGELSWIKQVSGAGNQQFTTMYIDSQGDLIVAGHFTKTLYFVNSNSETMDSKGGFNGFISKYSETGEFIWAQPIQGTGNTFIKGLSIDNTNNYYVVGDFTDSIFINTPEMAHNSEGESDVFLCKYTNSGNISWVKTVGSLYEDKAKCMTISGNNKMIVLGEFKDDLYCSGHKLLGAEGGDDIFQISFNSQGNFQQPKKYGLEQNDFIFDVGIPDGQNVLMATDLRINEDNKNTVLARYELFEDILATFQLGMDYNPTILSVTVPNENQIYYAGNFHGKLILDQITLSSNGNEDAFIIKLAPESLDMNASIPNNNNLTVINSDNFELENSDLNQISLNLSTHDSESMVFSNYPNPFKDKTQINYSLSAPSSVYIRVNDVNGKIIKTWKFEQQSLGNHSVEFIRPKDLDAGFYTCKIVAKGKNIFISKSIKLVCCN